MGLDFAMTVRVVRSVQRLNQEDIAHVVNVDRAIVSKLESGKINQPDLAFRILDRGGGVEMLDRLIEQIKAIRDWFVAEKHSQLLYA
jgi:transcriptional regulator with XRE-family HTH domain